MSRGPVTVYYFILLLFFFFIRKFVRSISQIRCCLARRSEVFRLYSDSNSIPVSDADQEGTGGADLPREKVNIQ